MKDENNTYLSVGRYAIAKGWYPVTCLTVIIIAMIFMM